MLRAVSVAVAVLACLAGFSATPFTHAHHLIDAAADEHHAAGETLVHSHASPHARHDAGHSDSDPTSHEGDHERIWSVNILASQQLVPIQTAAPVLVAVAAWHVPPGSLALSVDQPRPTAHGPPGGPPSGLRAPPFSLPAFV